MGLQTGYFDAQAGLLQKEYQIKAEALKLRFKAEQTKTNADNAAETAHQMAHQAQTAKASADALIQRYQTELPAQTAMMARRAEAYETLRTEKGLSEPLWMELITQHTREEIDRMQAKLHAHMQKKSAAEGALRSATQAVGTQCKPDLDQLDAVLDEATKRLTAQQEALEKLNDLYKTNRQALKALTPILTDRAVFYRSKSSWINSISGWPERSPAPVWTLKPMCSATISSGSSLPPTLGFKRSLPGSLPFAWWTKHRPVTERTEVWT